MYNFKENILAILCFFGLHGGKRENFTGNFSRRSFCDSTNLEAIPASPWNFQETVIQQFHCEHLGQREVITLSQSLVGVFVSVLGPPLQSDHLNEQEANVYL